MTRDLWLLAASVAFAMGCTFFASSYHPESYTVVQPETGTITVTGEVATRSADPQRVR
jgi:hypothetical protein